MADAFEPRERLHPMSWFFGALTFIRQFIVPLIAAAVFGALLGDDIALAQPASTGDAVLEPVDPARSGLDQYSADEGFKDVSIGAALTYGFLERWSVSGLASYTRLIGDAEDSPLVDDVGNENQFFAGALINYRFGSVGR
jgi:hypothetical protein